MAMQARLADDMIAQSQPRLWPWAPLGTLLVVGLVSVVLQQVRGYSPSLTWQLGITGVTPEGG